MSKRALLQPDEIKEKALRRYPAFLSAWLTNTPYFPLHIPGIGVPDESLAIAQQQVQSLKNGSKDVVDYFRQHPRPNVFAREIPLSVDTKFVEQNSGILEQRLDRVLPPETIRADERHFERRFGLRYPEPQFLLRFLDPELQRSAGSPWRECSVSLHALAESPIDATTVIIVENKVNLLTFPAVPSAIAMGGLGNGIVDLAYVTWLSNHSLWYWGDLDVEGFEILSRLRIRFPQTRSFLMDDTTLLRWKDSLAISGTARPRAVPALLTEPETTAFNFCDAHNMRIEQERIPQSAVVEAVSELILATGTFGVR